MLAEAVIVTGAIAAPLYTIPTSCESDVTCTLWPVCNPFDTCTTPLASLLEIVTGFAYVPEIGRLDEFLTVSENVPLAKDIDCPACVLGSEPMLNVFGI